MFNLENNFSSTIVVCSKFLFYLCKILIKSPFWAVFNIKTT